MSDLLVIEWINVYNDTKGGVPGGAIGVMNSRIYQSTFFVCMFFFLINCKSGTESNGSDNHFAHTGEMTLKKSVVNIDEQQRMVNSDFQKFAREAEAETMEIEKSIIAMRSDWTNSMCSADSVQVEPTDILYERCEELKCELKDYIQNGNGNWGTFKMVYYKKLKDLQADCISIE